MILEMYFSKKTRLIGFYMEPPTSLFSKYGVLEQKEYASYFHSLRIDMVRQMGLEPIRSRTRPSNVPVCQFQHCRALVQYKGTGQICQYLFQNLYIPFQSVFSPSKTRIISSPCGTKIPVARALSSV